MQNLCHRTAIQELRVTLLFPIYFKVPPRGKANLARILVGNPTLDKGPHGLGWQINDTTHFFAAVQKHLPRRELTRRSSQIDELREWNAKTAPVLNKVVLRKRHASTLLKLQMR